MADGPREGRADPKRVHELARIAPSLGHGDTNAYGRAPGREPAVKLAFYTELDSGSSSDKSESSGVAAEGDRERDRDGRKKRCIDRYDSSESSDSGVAVLSPTESSGCSGSDITEPGSPCSPASSCDAPEDAVVPRMPPWANEPAPAAGLRHAAQPPLAPHRAPPPAPAPAAPKRTLAAPLHRRITEYFNHKMKPHNALKRDSTCGAANDLPKKKCSPKNGVSHDLEKYLSYLSQTLSPRVQLDINKQTGEGPTHLHKGTTHLPNGVVNAAKLGSSDCARHHVILNNTDGLVEFSRHRAVSEKPTARVDSLTGSDVTKERSTKQYSKGSGDTSRNVPIDPSAYRESDALKRNDLVGTRLAPATSMTPTKSAFIAKTDFHRTNGLTTTGLDYKLKGVTCGSNNLNLNHITGQNIDSNKKEPPKKLSNAPKRTNRKSSACIANSKNLTWSKANNLKQVQLQKRNCINSVHTPPPIQNLNEINTTPKLNIPNGVRQVPLTVNSNMSNLNVPGTNFQSCHQINIQQSCNGTVTSSNLASFVAVPQNVMLTTLRIPQNGIAAQTVNQHSHMSAYSRPNVSVASPTKINGQFVFPFVQNINGAVVQIPNLMAKVAPNFVIPQSSQIQTQRQDISNQQAAQILFNGTLLKLANTVPSNFSNIPKAVSSSNVPMSPINKNVVPNMSAVSMAVSAKQNYTINVSHPVLVPQPGYIINSLPNINPKETWSSQSANCPSSTQSTVACANPIMYYPPPTNAIISGQTLHSSSVPIAPVKPPDKTTPSFDYSTIKDIPWLTKTVNNNIAPLDLNRTALRPFAQVCHLTEKLPEFSTLQKHVAHKKADRLQMSELTFDAALEKTSEELRRVEAVARREDTILSQITVLKDVSSNVQNAVIESNFSSVTNESSESGIGTDKSIDSPSDSLTSKEGDEDSTLSLSISVCSADVQTSQKSPILKQPKTLRFPPKSSSKADSQSRALRADIGSPAAVCLWEECTRQFESDTDLLEHLQVVHVESQVGRENYVCLWQCCKVRGKPSCSRLWLERHALSHGGNKPFKCIVDGCGRRFSTQILLERHVNNHFNEQSPNANSAKKTADSAPKLIRRNGKKLRYRRQPWSARIFDFFDAGTMEGLAWRLARCTRWRLGGCCPLREPLGGHSLTLHATVAATRYDAHNARTEALVSYHPPHVLEDEWLPEQEVKRVRRVEISQLPAHTKALLYEQFCASYRAPSPPPAPAAPCAAPPAKKAALRGCSGSRLLNNLIAKKRRDECAAPMEPLSKPAGRAPGPAAPEPSGAAKRKLGRRYGGNAFWPCGR